jgi:aminoglycoside phosphotransferase (APT) family kinase protein
MNTTMMPDQSTARELLRHVGMEVPEDRIRQVTGGTVNTAFRIDQGSDGPFVLRISPSDAEAEAGPSWLTSHGLRREQTTIGLLAEIAPLLPRTVYFDESRGHIDRDWVLQTWVRGDTWRDLRTSLTESEDLDLWRELGRITRQIHAIVGQEFGPPEDGLGYATWSDLIRWDVSGFVVDAHRYGVDLEPFEQLQSLVDRVVPVLNEVTEARLVHSDLNQQHVFVARDSGGQPRITGLIDFEFARFADPYSESVFIDGALLPSNDGRDVALCEGYECDSPTNQDLLRKNIYTMIAIGWTVMDLARKGQPKQISAMLGRMQDVFEGTREFG